MVNLDHINYAFADHHLESRRLLFLHPGWVLLDRSGKHFHLILNYLRDGSVPLPENRQDLEELLVETRFYCLEGLRRVCEEKLDKLVAEESQEKPNAASIYIVKYPKVTKAIFSSTKKVNCFHCKL